MGRWTTGEEKEVLGQKINMSPLYIVLCVLYTVWRVCTGLSAFVCQALCAHLITDQRLMVILSCGTS